MKFLLEHWPKLLAIALIISAYLYVNNLITTNEELQKAISDKNERIERMQNAIEQAEVNAAATEKEFDQLLEAREREIRESIEISRAANQREQQLQNDMMNLKKELMNENGPTDCAFQPMPDSGVRVLNGAGTPNGLSDKDSDQTGKSTGG
ncbi:MULTISPECIES: OmpH family outer membrane protein [Shewanella]|uniref:OmpH family outer membrane protein n=1 Tax=Shewanella TaxID=22 RepID=UPI001AB0094D|nr:OmpH family outer membrane protein [Shewanella algae]MBO2580229.1 hypothetical protein [Shewanella algae]HDS1207816.1 hypothetical protein [Shewanella algae]